MTGRNDYGSSREPGVTGRWFFVAWDFDYSLRGPPDMWYHNGLIRRLEADHPGYNARAAARWNELRHGPLRIDALDGLVDAAARPLEPYWPWHAQRWRLTATQSVAQAAATIKSILHARLEFLDAAHGRQPAVPPPLP